MGGMLFVCLTVLHWAWLGFACSAISAFGSEARCVGLRWVAVCMSLGCGVGIGFRHRNSYGTTVSRLECCLNGEVCSDQRCTRALHGGGVAGYLPPPSTRRG